MGLQAPTRELSRQLVPTPDGFVQGNRECTKLNLQSRGLQPACVNLSISGISYETVVRLAIKAVTENIFLERWSVPLKICPQLRSAGDDIYI